MNSPLSSITDRHLSNGVLVQFIDDELPAAEAAHAQKHLAQCPACSDRYSELRKVSSSFDEFVESLRPSVCLAQRQELASKLDRVSVTPVSHTEVRRPGRFALWGLAAS